MKNELILLVAGAIIGLLAGQGNELLRLRREERRAFGRALKTLLYVRAYLYSLKMTTKAIREHHNPPSQQIVQFQHFMQTHMLPNAASLFGKYEEAIDVVSGVKPLLGLRLAKQTELLPMIMRYTQLMGQHEEASKLWPILEKHISEPSLLDKLILEVARLHHIETHDEVRGHLDDPITLPTDLENLLKETATAEVIGSPSKKEV